MTRLFAGTPFDRPPTCDRCGELESVCRCPPAAEPVVPPEKQSVKVAVEKRKQGRMATVIRGLAQQSGPMQELLKTLKSKCGAGGTIVEGNIEIQGDQGERVRSVLKDLGYKVRNG